MISNFKLKENAKEEDQDEDGKISHRRKHK
jgi:hypothetical protein